MSAKQLSVAFLLVLVAKGITQGTTNWPKDRGLIFTTYYTWSSEIKGRIRHLQGFPGYEIITGEYAGYDDAITPDIPNFAFINEDTKMQSIDVDFREKSVFMHDDFSSTIAYIRDYNTDLNNITINNMDLAASKGTAQVAVDWLSHTVYWTDTLFRRIMAVPGQPDKLKMGYYKIIIEESVGAPMGIAVDPHEGLLFWSDVGAERKIERSNLDGNLDSRETFYLADNSYPSCLELDRKERKIYWIERSLDKILYMTYEGKERTLLKGMSGVTLYDMALFRDVLYVSDTYEGYLYTINKTKEGNGKMEAEIITYYPHDIYGVAVFSEETQPLRDRDYCAILKCDQFCITIKGSAICACAEGHSLNSSTRKCEEDKKFLGKAIVFANATHICMVDTQVLILPQTKHFCVFTVIKQQKSSPIPNMRRRRQVDSSTTAAANSPTPTAANNPTPSSTPPTTHTPTTMPKTTIPPTPTPPATTTVPTTTMIPTAAPGDIIKHFDMDMKNRIFFIVTADNSIYKRLIDLSIENDAKELIVKASGNISGIVYDAEDSNNLYWCESNTNNIWVVNIVTRAVRKVNLDNETRIDNPRSLIIMLKERKLAMITGTDDGDERFSIKTMTLDGQNVDVVVSGKNEISSFYYNREEQRFYYNRGAYAYKASPDGKIDSVEHYGVSIHTYILLQYQNFIVWVYHNDTHSNIVRSRNTLTNVNMNLVSFDNSELVDMKPLDASIQNTDVVSPCAYDNGGCSQICVTHYVDSKITRVCECPIGYTVENEVNCTTNNVDDNFLLVTDWSIEEILQIDNLTNEVHVVPGDEDAEYMGIFVDQKKKRMIWAHYFDEEVVSANFNGSDRKVIADLGYSGYAYRFDQDVTTGNIYYTAYFDTYLGLITPDGHYTILSQDFGWDSLLDIAVYPVKGWMYFTLDGYPSYVGRSNMDGSNHEQLISGDHVGYPDGLAINHITDRLYWSDATYDTIQDCDMDGQDCITIVNMTALSIREEIRDLVTDGVYLYYSTYRKDHVVRVSLKKPYTRTPVGQNYALGKLDSMTLYSSTDINIQKPNSLCQARNGLGDCSTICVPTELSRTCACEDGVSLKADQRTCENIYQCPILIEQKVTSDTGLEKTIEITIERTCNRFLHDKCNYECPNNYEPLFDTEMSCTSAGWSMESRTLCKEVRCPLTVGNGKIVGDCKREVGDKCEYQCNTGFIQTRTAAVCTKTGQYHEPEGGFCIPFKCSDTIENGMMGKDCTRLTGSTCDYMCNKFYAPNPKYPKAQCQGTGWSPDSSSLCQETTCQADSFPNGQFSPTCLHKIGDACTFTCKPGYVKTTELAFCKNDKMWHPEDACSESICEDTSLTNGKVIGSCSKKIGIDCAVVCNQGYVNMTDKAFCRNDKK
ncbi:low-density lipoprotein receptor-related protein 2-like, partial [Ruditapes philippinarum]|uniref:low-density lipoprotein receptor-related protein 2-like n=1 Tax=Ruditapes philippinarum TaxID=129788 RepID=UPI00295A9E86